VTDASWWDDARYGLFVQRDDVLTVRLLPDGAPDQLDTVIEIDLDRGPDALPGSSVFWAGEARY
jgi:hypothetical protein